MPDQLAVTAFADLLVNDNPLLDVRAPGEFQRGAFPCAHNIPLLEDSERKAVGIRYKQEGQETAIALGEKLISGELRANRIQSWLGFIKTNPYGAIYCFRGGLRSKTVQTWLAAEGINIPIIQGGYKALRRFCLNTLDRVSKQEKFIERFRSKATKASQVRSREKALNKIMPLEKITSDLEVSFKFDTATRTERDVLKAQNIGHSYNGNEIVLIDANLQVERGDKVMFIGPNGGGKSTLFKILAGEITPTHGDISWANRAELGYYDQHQDEALDYDLTVLEEVQTVNKEHGDGVLRNILGNFLFRGDDVFKSVSVLSGGERSRLALAKFLINPGNVLLLDEPTNHLDRTTQRKLISALENYEGTIICASHDRELLEKVATRVIKVNDGECIELNNWHNISEVLTSN